MESCKYIMVFNIDSNSRVNKDAVLHRLFAFLSFFCCKSIVKLPTHLGNCLAGYIYVASLAS